MKEMKTMFITKGTQQLRDGSVLPTFRLVPLMDTCPWLICEFDTHTNALVLVSKTMKEELEKMVKLDEFGQPMMGHKGGQQMPKIDRKLVPQFFECHLTDSEGIIEFINLIAVNSDKSNIYMPYLSAIQPLRAGETMEKPKSLILEA